MPSAPKRGSHGRCAWTGVERQAFSVGPPQTARFYGRLSFYPKNPYTTTSILAIKGFIFCRVLAGLTQQDLRRFLPHARIKEKTAPICRE